MIRQVVLHFAVVCFALTGTDAEAKSAKNKVESKKTSSKLGTDHVFSDASVRGKYQYADEGSVTVEDEKELIDLLGMRRHFKDRLDVETSRN